jgi:amino acid transporter
MDHFRTEPSRATAAWERPWGCFSICISAPQLCCWARRSTRRPTTWLRTVARKQKSRVPDGDTLDHQNIQILADRLVLINRYRSGKMSFSHIQSYYQFGIAVPWWIFSTLFVAIIWGIAALGINRSAQTALVSLVLEVGVMAALFITIVGAGGAQGISAAPFNPANSLHGISGLGIGMLWGILFFIGFESAATLGEETHNAHRSIPIALFAAVGIIGVNYVFSGYAAAIGFGQDSVDAFVRDDTPWSTLTERYWGQGSLWVITLTVLNSIFANLLTGCNAAVRVIFALGREGFFPRALGRVSSGGRPLVALSAYMIFSLLLALVGGALIGPFGIYGFCGTILGLGLVIIYILINLALMRFYRREHPEEFSTVRHAILPMIASLLLLLPIYGLVYPVPAFPNNLVPYIIVVWIALGFVYLTVISRRSPETLDAMGRVWGDEPA